MINGPDNSSGSDGGIMCTVCSYDNGHDYIPSINQIYKTGSDEYWKTTLFTKNEISKEDKTNEKEKED